MRYFLVAMLALMLIDCRSKGETFNDCNSLQQNVSSNDYEDRVSCSGSSMLSKAEYYDEKEGYVIAWYRSGKSYIWCGVSKSDWNNFKSKGGSESWGKAFREYIDGSKCDC